jgi:hypothetical protein
VTEALCAVLVALVAVIVYTPAAEGAVNDTGAPLAVLATLSEPPEEVQVTPDESLVVAETCRVCVTVMAARAMEIATVLVPELIVIGRLALFVCAGLAASVTVKVTGVAAAVAVGVPEMPPVVPFSARPAGRVPLVTAHMSGGVPPLAVSVAA